MDIEFFCPHWGSENLERDAFLRKIKQAGYQGTEIVPPDEPDQQKALKENAHDLGLKIIGHVGGPISGNFQVTINEYERQLRRACSVDPIFVNAQTGKDFFSYEQNMAFIDLAKQIGDETGTTIVHETHRGKFSFAAHIMQTFLHRNKDMRITADFSHWCCVAESLLEEQTEAMQIAIERSDHIHARVGFEEGPQVNDPSAPEWKLAIDAHLSWWDSIVEHKKEQGHTYLSITPEFGPWPYMPHLPFTQQPISSQWNANLYMMTLLRHRYTK